MSFFTFATSMWMSFQPWMVGGHILLNLLPQLTAAFGNYTYVQLRIWVNYVAVAPGGRHRHCRVVDVLFCFALGTLGQSLNYSSLLHSESWWLFHCWFTTLPACHMWSTCLISHWWLPICRRPASTPLACLYAAGLPLCHQGLLLHHCHHFCHCLPTSSSS